MEKRSAVGRRRAARCVLGAIVAAVLLSAGCDKALESYNQGEDLLAHNQYDEAVARFDAAYQQCRQKRGRDCSMYEEKLTYARHLAGEHYFNLAQTDLIAARLDGAARHIAKALEHGPANGVYLSFRERVLAETLAVETLRRHALDCAGRQEWDAAVEAMQQAMARNRTMSGAQGDLDRIKRDAYAFHLAAARGLLEAGQWDEAVIEANTALRYNAGAEAKALIAEVSHRREALALIAEARMLRESGADAQAVLETLEKARQLYPLHPEIATLILEAKQAVCDVKIALAVQAIDAGALHEALRLLNESRRVLKDYGGAGDLIAVISERIARRHTEAGDLFAERQQYGNAALHYVTAMHYRDNLPQARAGLIGALGPLRETIKYSIGYVGFNCAWQDRKAAEGIEAGLLQHISKARPANIVIKDASAFKTILSSVNTNIIEIDVLDIRSENAWPRDTDALMLGQILHRDFTVSEAVTTGRSQFQSGTRMEPNADYHKVRTDAERLSVDHAAAVAELVIVRVKAEKMLRRTDGESEEDYRRRSQDAQKMISTAEKKAASLHVASEKARGILAHTPPHLAIPIISEYEYPIVRVTRTARIGVFLKMVDARTGAVLVAEKLEGAYAAADSYIVPDPARNVPGDALELPADDFIMKKATEQIMGKLFGLCDSYLANHSKRFVAMMNQARSDGDEEAAVEYGMRYLITPGNGGADRNNTIAYVRGVAAGRNEGSGPDLGGLFARYYKP
ncbi:MAG: hypothetical protein IH624_11235 [Phycisphaerae bacterium]|nr:hypothetical protein [Phycisphaerae bacterium]